jgi:hypothetical protein
MTRPKKITKVREHPRKVPVSAKNPTGQTIVDQHNRLIAGSYLDREQIAETKKGHPLNSVIFPNSDDLGRLNGSKYDELIAIWTDYFNKKFNEKPLLDPNVVKALISSESDFKLDPKNAMAIGIAQITKSTLKILQDPHGEVKDFIFREIRQKDLKDPEIAIPMAVRWLFRKKQTARSKLKKAPTAEQIVLEYKGLLKSSTSYQKKSLENFREFYDRLNKKTPKRNPRPPIP